MTALAFHGPYRRAAQHLLDNTNLGHTVPLFAQVRDDGRLLTVTPTAPPESYLRDGMELLYEFLVALSGSGTVNIGRLIRDIDADSAFAAVWAMGLALGKFAEMTPVRFGAAS